KGIRGEEPVDIDIIVEYIQRLSQFATDFDMIKELDINPFMVCNSPDCCKVVDARIMLK
nr:hypothetical protein [Fodinibius sp.]NIW96759.1 hypothetical protein [Phycisphaerae bacterium]NIY26713.1 hypothetical protein [Fodinibius sp.]